jgi:hypothetical protein
VSEAAEGQALEAGAGGPAAPLRDASARDVSARDVSARDAVPRAVGPRSARAEVLELLAVGGLTPFLWALAWAVRWLTDLDRAEYAVGFVFFYAAHLVNDPHFSVTYLLFYDDVRGRALGPTFPPRLRARYVFAGFVVPLALSAWAFGAVALRSAHALGLLFQLMFLLVGWHYVKQGFGVLVLLAGRRGAPFSPHERLALLGHCFAAWAHGFASPADPGRVVEEKQVVFRTLPHGPALEQATELVLFASLAPVVWTLAARARREGLGPLRRVAGPLAVFLGTLWWWTVYSSADRFVVYMIPALHSAQYLYVVWLLRRNQAREREGPPHFEPTRTRLAMLAVSALGLGALLFHGVPEVLDSLFTPRSSRDTPLGPTPYLAALVAVINLHHYFMDNVIWRRDNPLTRHLRA